MADTVRLFIDGVEYHVPRGANLVDAAKMVGNDIPVFCYHPKLDPAGMCRMCLVELGQANVDKATGEFVRDDKGEIAVRWQPKLVTACTMTVADGMFMRTATEVVKTARDDILEFLLTSHPLDCPICDKGGECPLQNLTLRHGPGKSRFIFDEKMRLAKHYPLGELIYLDRERCIQCARCTRFQEELVGDPVLGFHERGRRLQIITTSNPPFDTYFSGNTTDICPVGALTTADFRFGARPWELTEVPTICPHCPVGCNMSASTRQDRDAGGEVIIKRIMPRQNEQVNEIWICDKGRFGHHHSRHPDRLMTPLVRQGGMLVPATFDEAFARIAEYLQAAGGNVGAIAGPMLSNEDLWELRQLVERAGGSTANLGVWPYRMTGADLIAKVGVGVGTNFKDMGKETTIVVIASDLENEAPVWYLRVKGARDRGARLIVLNARPTKLENWAAQGVRYTYGDEITALKGLDLSGAQNVVILVGGDGLDRAHHGALMQAAAHLLVAGGHVGKPNNGLLAVWPGANTQGAFDMGFTSEATEAMFKARPGVLFLADADIVRGDPAGRSLLGTEGAFTVAVEMFLTPTAERADVVLPRQSFAERDGAYTNGERRVQRFYAAQALLANTMPDWRMFAEINRLLGGPRPKLSASSVMAEITQRAPHYAGMNYAALARLEKQFPDVGGVDLYYGGTAYDNRGGLGIQWATQADAGDKVSVPDAKKAARPKHKDDSSLLIVPVTRLYNREAAFLASTPLMAMRIGEPFAVLNPDDAARLGIADGDVLGLS
ncbi:MAG: NADH-quinone oxidoreductase subunit NuoG, partial [Anaerolineae bacterium]|nr:NADH-quinone oxidoreductase subunit NuoG [Anaerolineae bacterium]